jgi:glucosylceramidase
MTTPKTVPAVKALALLLAGMTLTSHWLFAGNVEGVETSAATKFKPLAPMTFAADDNSTLPTVTVNPAVTCQTIVGFGGAFTESSATVLNQIPKAKRAEVLSAYFSPTAGAGYTLCRVPIGSCDFALSSYSYDETPGDKTLANFSIAHDKTALIPMIKDAMAVPGAKFQLLASPWTPPSWMTTKGRLVAGQNHLARPFYDVYANYLARYVKDYAAEGVAISYMTVQNESWNDSGAWETTQFQPPETASFVKVLGPAFAENNIQTKIMIYDHNKGANDKGENQIKYYVDHVYSDAEARKYIWGVGFHWYGATQTDPFTDMKVTHEAYPEQHLIHTEACAEGGPHPNDYAVGEHYGHDILGCLNNWTEGWIDWNLVLDTTGGPNHAHNLCSAPILADTAGGTLLYNPSYYYMAHFSRYFRPGAVVISTTSSDPTLEAVTCKNPDGKFAMVVLNRTDNPINFKINDGGQVVKPTITAHSIMTLVF